jgi:hypothetical protein
MTSYFKISDFLDIHFPGLWVVGVMDQFPGLRAHPILLRLISSCGDTLRTLFTRPV